MFPTKPMARPKKCCVIFLSMKAGSSDPICKAVLL